MEIFTVGREIYKGYHLKLRYLSHKELLQENPIKYCYKIIYVEKGNGIARINKNSHIFSAPCIFCLDEFESILFDNTDSISVKAIGFHPEVINKNFSLRSSIDEANKLLKSELQDEYLLRLFTVRSATYSGLLNLGPLVLKRINIIFELLDIELQAQKDSDWPCRSRSYLFELLIILRRVLSDGQTINNVAVSEKYPEIAQILLYIHTNYMNKITIPEIAKKFNVNRTTLGIQFSEVTGLPVVSYLIKLRVEIASMLLRDTLLPISEITERVGFVDRTNFYRLFSKHMGCIPSEYRKKNSSM